jgi:hypothetical protein
VVKNQLDPDQRFLCISMVKPIVTDSAEAFGKNMLQNEEKKIRRRKGARFTELCSGFRIFERNVSIGIIKGILFLSFMNPIERLASFDVPLDPETAEKLTDDQFDALTALKEKIEKLIELRAKAKK